MGFAHGPARLNSITAASIIQFSAGEKPPTPSQLPSSCRQLTSSLLFPLYLLVGRPTVDAAVDPPLSTFRLFASLKRARVSGFFFRLAIVRALSDAAYTAEVSEIIAWRRLPRVASSRGVELSRLHNSLKPRIPDK